LDGALLLAVHLHKAKFEQRKALEEYRSGEPVSGFLPSEVYDRSEKMVKARGENTERISVEDAWKAVAEGETWVGSLPVQMHRKQQVVLAEDGFRFQMISHRNRNAAERIL